MRILGINCMNHDAAMAVVEIKDGLGKILWAAHAERYSKVKNDHYLNWDIVNQALTYGPFHKVVYYEKPILKKTRQFYATQFTVAFDRKEMPEYHLKQFGLKIGFKVVESGPLVRSSYHADQQARNYSKIG